MAFSLNFTLLMLVEVAPGTTHIPWVRRTRTSFDARVFSVSYMSEGRVSSVKAPSAAVDKLLASPLLGIPGPHVHVRTISSVTPLIIEVLDPKATPYGTLTASYYKQPTVILFGSAMRATPIGLTFFYAP